MSAFFVICQPRKHGDQISHGQCSVAVWAPRSIHRHWQSFGQSIAQRAGCAPEYQPQGPYRDQLLKHVSVSQRVFAQLNSLSEAIQLGDVRLAYDFGGAIEESLSACIETLLNIGNLCRVEAGTDLGRLCRRRLSTLVHFEALGGKLLQQLAKLLRDP